MSTQLEVSASDDQSGAWIARQPWYVRALIYGFIAGWFAACGFLIARAVVAALS